MAKPTLNPQEAQLSRRAFFYGIASLAAGTILTGRLYHLQFLKSDKYQTLAEGNRIKIQLLPPPRGQLLDRIAIPLAENRTNFRFFIEREQKEQAKKSFAKIRSILTFPPARLALLEKEISQPPNRKPLLVKEYLSWDELSALEFHIPELPSTYIEEGQLRHYPLAEEAAHLIGYVGRVAESNIEDKPLYRLPEFKIGKDGSELLLEEKIQGTAGTRQIEVNVSGLSVRPLSQTDAIKGEDIVMSIDAELQSYASKALKDQSGAIIVMDAHRGDVLALASMPAFDPNLFSLGITNTYWKELNSNEKNPLVNKAIAGLYPPGSTFKMVIGLAGLKAGIISAATRFFCPGHYYLGNHRFNCWKPGGHGTIDIRNALAESCDTFFYNVAERLGIEKLSAMAFDLGLGAHTGIGLSAEKAGTIPTPEWKRKQYNQSWRTGDTINASIGQGYVLTTPLQLALMTARLINGGKKITPTLLRTVSPAKTTLMDIDPAHLELVREGMDRVCNAPNGTAFWTRVTEGGFSMGGKTGTSQVRRITQRGQNQNLIPWKFRHHGLFVGYAPIESPRFVASVIIEHGGGGSSAAAPVAKDVLLKVQQLNATSTNRF